MNIDVTDNPSMERYLRVMQWIKTSPDQCGRAIDLFCGKTLIFILFYYLILDFFASLVFWVYGNVIQSDTP